MLFAALWPHEALSPARGAPHARIRCYLLHLRHASGASFKLQNGTGAAGAQKCSRNRFGNIQIVTFQKPSFFKKSHAAQSSSEQHRRLCFESFKWLRHKLARLGSPPFGSPTRSHCCLSMSPSNSSDRSFHCASKLVRKWLESREPGVIHVSGKVPM